MDTPDQEKMKEKERCPTRVADAQPSFHSKVDQF